MKSGDSIRSASSRIVIGSAAVPVPCVLLTGVSTIVGNLAFRHVANRATQLLGALVKVVDTDEIDELREERERSEIIDSGLETDEAEGAKDEDRLTADLSPSILQGKRSRVHRDRPLFCADAIAMLMLGRRELQTLAAGVFTPTDDGVI